MSSEVPTFQNSQGPTFPELLQVPKIPELHQVTKFQRSSSQFS